MNATDLCFLSAIEQKALLDRRELSVVELVDATIGRIERVNPLLNAFVTLRLDEARDEAVAADGARAGGDDIGVLHGLPIGVKDCFATKGIRTTFASLAFKDHVPDFDHLVVEREKAAGAIILGKLNTPEYTMALNTCDNPVFGPTRNPYDTSLCPGASSGGSGAALARRAVFPGRRLRHRRLGAQPGRLVQHRRPPPDIVDDPRRAQSGHLAQHEHRRAHGP